MKLLLENWRKLLKEGDVIPIRSDIEMKGGPKVEAHCECHDCIFNKNYYCVAEKINLDFAQTNEGKWICECLTYEVSEDEEPGPHENVETLKK